MSNIPTKRERDVLQLTAEGKTNAEIAAALFLGIETIKTHKRRIRHKFAVRNQTQAVAVAVSEGFIIFPDKWEPEPPLFGTI